MKTQNKKTGGNKMMEKWHSDHTKIETDRVQYWRRGVMVTAMMPKETAVKLVKRGQAFVISDQAIGCLDPNGRSDA
jgi:hypothetical protein